MSATPKVAVSDVKAALVDRVGEAAVTTASEDLDAYTADTYWPALAAVAAGTPLARPEIVVRPETEEDVAAVVAVAAERGTPVATWGGGSGTQGGALPIHGGIVLDMRSLDQVIEVDETSMTVTVQAGANGRRLEAALNDRGLMLPHYPASVEWATIGGYIAARGSGVLSTRYGKIEDLVLTLRVATPATGLIDTVGVPRHAVGPELTQVFVGSEGTLGVITRATLQLVPLPQERRFATVSFPSVGAGIHAIRRALQVGHRPSVVRMYDEEATRLTFAPVVGEDLSGVYTVLAFEGDSAAVDVEERRTLELAARGGRRAARSSSRRSAGGTAATTSTTRRTSPSCLRSGGRSTSWRPTRASRRSTTRCTGRCACPTRRTVSSCACTCPTGTRGAR